MDPISLLLGFISIAELIDRVGHITVSPFTWHRLNASVTERWIFWSGFEPGEFELPPNKGLRITIDYEQDSDFRIWDRDGKEVRLNWGKVYPSMHCDC